jgi:hypothetical protein
MEFLQLFEDRLTSSSIEIVLLIKRMGFKSCLYHIIEVLNMVLVHSLWVLVEEVEDPEDTV